MDGLQKRREPWLDDDDKPGGPQYAPHLRENAIQISRQLEQMVEAALDDHDVLAAVRKRQSAAVPDVALRETLVFGDEPRGKVHAFDVAESQLFKGPETVAATAEKLDDLRVLGPAAGADLPEPAEELADFILRRFEPQISGFPSVN